MISLVLPPDKRFGRHDRAGVGRRVLFFGSVALADDAVGFFKHGEPTAVLGVHPGAEEQFAIGDEFDFDLLAVAKDNLEAAGYHWMDHAAEHLGTATRLGGDRAQQIAITETALVEGGKIGIGWQEEVAVDRFQMLGGCLDRFFKSTIPAQRQQFLSRQAGLIVFGAEMPANTNDDCRLAPANGAVFDLSIDLVDFENAIVIVVPVCKTLIDQLDQRSFLFLLGLGGFWGRDALRASCQKKCEDQHGCGMAHDRRT